MANNVTLSKQQYENLTGLIRALEKKIDTFLEKVDFEPPYGSDEWWEWSDKKAMEDVKAGRVLKFNSVKEAIKWLNS